MWAIDEVTGWNEGFITDWMIDWLVRMIHIVTGSTVQQSIGIRWELVNYISFSIVREFVLMCM